MKFKFTPRKEKKLIYYSEKQRIPAGLHQKIIYTIAITFGLPLAIIVGIYFFGDMVGYAVFPGFTMIVWLGALCFMAYEYWHRPLKAYREPKAPVDIDSWD